MATMEELLNARCQSCHREAQPVSEKEKEDYLKKLSEWDIVTQQGTPRLIRHYPVKSFSLGMAFANKVGLTAEKENHHPVIIIGPEKVIIKWWTHVIGNLHYNDFIMAAKTDSIFNDLPTG